MKPLARRAPAAARRERMRAAQVGMLYRAVSLGVIAAGIAASMLSATLIRLGATPAALGIPWAAYILAGAGFHLWLKRRYDAATAASRAERWRYWGWAFTAVSFAEGCGWGWASVALAAPDRMDMQLLVMLATYAIAAGAIPAFGSFLPAFWGLYAPTSIPYALRGLLDGRLEPALIGILATIYVAGMASVAMRAYRELKGILLLGFEKEELAARLAQEKERAEAASLAKSRFLAAASHDLRQPVHALGLFIGALRACDMSSSARRLVNHIESSVTALDGLFSALLNMSELDANVVPNRPQRFPLRPLLERICRDHADEAAAKGLALRLVPCSLAVEADPVLLERVIRNLVSNAVRHTERGGVLIGCRRGSRVRIEVWDTGPGIPPDLRDAIFQEYFQVGNPERDRSKGLGLGLAIVQRLTTLMGADLTLRSASGRGSVFALAVPAAPLLTTAAAPPVQDQRQGWIDRGGSLILVIDDEAAILTAMQSLLQDWGYRTLCAGSGAEMLRSVADCAIQPALLICDYRLRDGEDGIAVIRRLQEEYNGDLPAILITGDTAPERLAEAKASGLQLLHKPVSQAKLQQAIAAAVPVPAPNAA